MGRWTDSVGLVRAAVLQGSRNRIRGGSSSRGRRGRKTEQVASADAEPRLGRAGLLHAYYTPIALTF